MHETLEWRKTAAVGFTERIRKLNQQFHSTRPNICLHSARAYTQVFKETEGAPYPIRRGKALRRVFETMPPVIMPYELIVGQPACRLRGMTVRINAHGGWMAMPGELEELDTRAQDPWVITPEQKRELREEILPYWKGRTLREIWTERMKAAFPETWWITVCTLATDNSNFLHSPGSHINPPYGEIINEGIVKYEKKAKEKLASLDLSNPENIPKSYFYQSVLEVIEGIKAWQKNYAAKARELAQREKDPQRKKELMKIAERCERVPYYPARNFAEALQSIYFVQCFLWMEGCGVSFSLGRFDQYMYPFYKKDLEEGRLTRDQAKELLECLWIKLTGIHWLNSKQNAYFFPGYFPFQNLQVGGVKEGWVDATNDLTYLVIEALMDSRTTQPTVSVFWHKNMPEKLKLMTAELVSLGMGHPSIFSMESTAEMRMNASDERWEDLWDAKIIGCVEPQGAGCRQFGHSDSAQVNGGSIVEFAYTRGIKRYGLPMCEQCQQCKPPPERALKRLVGLDTGDPRNFKTFEEFKEAVKKQMDWLIDLTVKANWVAESVYRDYMHLPMQSMFTEDCLERGKDVVEGGARYPVGPHIILIGTADIADSMAAIKKLIYDEKKITWDQLLKALEANFEGYEEIRRMCLDAPKFGNDDDYVDSIAAEMFEHFGRKVRQYKNLRGGIVDPAVVPVSQNVPYGLQVGALPSGRLAQTPLAEGVSPFHGVDAKGPTAALRSVTKLNHQLFTGGTLLNLWISGASLRTPEGKKKFVDLIDTYVYLGGHHIQVNSVSKETLRDAQVHPEKYPTLMVRVAGYSAYFVDLAKPTQDDVIGRTEHIL
jgi:formate C-acetyltransferase